MPKKIAIMQPYLFPYLGYFQLIHSVDQFIFLDDVNFIKKGWINRNTIATQNGPYRFTMPIAGASQNKKINELELIHDEKFYRSFMTTLHQSYKDYAFYREVLPLIETTLKNPTKNLAHFIIQSVQTICDYLGIKTPLHRSSELPQFSDLSGENRIIEIVKHFEGDHYINPIGGVELYSKEHFFENGIQLHFLNTRHDLIPADVGSKLSIIHLLLTQTKAGLTHLLSQYELA